MPITRHARSVGDVLDAALVTEPEREALVANDRRLTYAELDRAADQAAGALYELGVRAGEVIAVSLPNASDVVVTFYAVMRLGCVWLGINRNLAPPEKAFILRDAGARLLLTAPAAADTLGEATDAVEVRVEPVGPDVAWWQEIQEEDARPYLRMSPPTAEAAGLAYTSGTTGRPKGVLHSHENLLLPGAVFAATRGFGPDLRKGDCAALTILNMQITSTLLAAQAGGTQVVMDKVDPVGMADWIRREAVNAWFGVPTMLHGLATSPDVMPEQLASLTDVWTGGADLAPSIRRAFEERFGLRVSATYGLTEVPTIVTVESPTAPAAPGSSGTPLPHLVVEVRDDDGQVLEQGEIGEVTVRARTDGPWAGRYRPMLGYLGQPDATASTVRDGVLYTGDLGALDENGNLLVRDRRRALIVRGGANVYPAEVERVLLEVDGVVGAAVVGFADERLGERVAAAVELTPGVRIEGEALQARCLSQLARYKVPEQWAFRSLPRNAMGKVVRTEVEQWFAPASDGESISR